MSAEDFTLEAQAREVSGKGASRRLRRLENSVPAIVYGAEKEAQKITVSHKDLVKHLDNEAFYSHLITLNIGDQSESVVLKDLQRHPAKPQIIHVDFMRVSQARKLTMNVPLHFINEESCPGVKIQGGKISHSLSQIEVSCLPKDIPEYIEIDMGQSDTGTIIHISDLKLPAGVESVALHHGSGHDLPVASVIKAKGAEDDDEQEDGEE